MDKAVDKVDKPHKGKAPRQQPDSPPVSRRHALQTLCLLEQAYPEAT